jgi:hypothetical protein
VQTAALITPQLHRLWSPWDSSNLVHMGCSAVHNRPLQMVKFKVGLACRREAYGEGLRRRYDDASGAELGRQTDRSDHGEHGNHPASLLLPGVCPPSLSNAHQPCERLRRARCALQRTPVRMQHVGKGLHYADTAPHADCACTWQQMGL